MIPETSSDLKSAHSSELHSFPHSVQFCPPGVGARRERGLQEHLAFVISRCSLILVPQARRRFTTRPCDESVRAQRVQQLLINAGFPQALRMGGGFPCFGQRRRHAVYRTGATAIWVQGRTGQAYHGFAQQVTPPFSAGRRRMNVSELC
ncbi:hypothetical protein IE81DRAFT_254213 [Ceraceosorus guamensis]|uniref:Rhodanese domain-containing protein n=1 Tax=Ceraceosorus guamensis TaxID=1522189 RepID=A0A316W4S4_9BASI|nr:hypothetical protein IE81DRAFT_254213 [Ceraceosorus guamensis]PWN44759.1 hypothetical protein IE81DRAFT_254213 [Ceraceosorus guamensis]